MVDAQRALDELLITRTDSHPDVVLARQHLDAVKASVAKEAAEQQAQIADLNALALQKQTQHVGRAGLRRCVHHGAAPIAAPDRHQALGFQDSQRFQQRDQADVELFDEHLLAGQEITVGQLAVNDLTAQLVGYDFSDPRGR